MPKKRLPHALSEDQVRTARHVTQLIPGRASPPMYACGLRISEATHWRSGSVDRANQVLRIIGKGDKDGCTAAPTGSRRVRNGVRTHRTARWLSQSARRVAASTDTAVPHRRPTA